MLFFPPTFLQNDRLNYLLFINRDNSFPHFSLHVGKMIKQKLEQKLELFIKSLYQALRSTINYNFYTLLFSQGNCSMKYRTQLFSENHLSKLLFDFIH